VERDAQSSSGETHVQIDRNINSMKSPFHVQYLIILFMLQWLSTQAHEPRIGPKRRGQQLKSTRDLEKSGEVQGEARKVETGRAVTISNRPGARTRGTHTMASYATDAATKRVYRFGPMRSEGDSSMRSLLGGKARSLTACHSCFSGFLDT
jgi:hypothetical protein